MKFFKQFLDTIKHYSGICISRSRGFCAIAAAAVKEAVRASGRTARHVYAFAEKKPKFILVLGVAMTATGLIGLSMPDLSGVEKGVKIKVKVKGRHAGYRYISPGSDGFVSSGSLPKHVIGAILTSEDDEFYSHNGINFEEMLKAAQYDLKHLTLKQGGSTITQQVVKNVYLSGEKTFTRKAVEAVTAIRLEKKLSKRQILDYYINLIEFGNGIYGINQASKFYFNKSPRNLTAKEAAMLAVLMPRPVVRGRILTQTGKEEFQKKRVSNLLRRMKANGYIGEDGA
ncbi:MAG: transglycosylase domain-containing protein [Spirochaetia bacterium]|nr:transglycosylase domain-containing protein [Spirochaetia bacterium]